VTPDFINPRNPWPLLQALESACAVEGFVLRPRMPIYDAFVERPGFLDASLLEITRATQRRLSNVSCADDLADSTATRRSLSLVAGSA
jgi:hypothetical protein